MKWASSVVLLAGLLSCNRPLNTSQTDSVASRISPLIASGNQEAILDHFEYPETTDVERSRDRAGVRKLLSILYSDFGSIEQMSRSKSLPNALDLLVAPGTVEQLNRKESFKRYIYDAKFTKYGDGYVYIDVSKRLDGKFGLRSVSFALPLGRSETAGRIRTTSQRMIETLK